MKRIGPVFVIAAFFAQSLLASAKKVPQSRDESEYFEYPAETWIVEQFKGGWVADLSLVFPNERDRRIRGSFLRKVLTETSKRYAASESTILMLVNAILEGDLNINDGEVSRRVVFEKCRMNSVNLTGSVFRRGLELRQCALKGFEAPLEVGDDLDLSGSTINGPLQICDSRINGNIYADDLKVKGTESHVCISGTVTKQCRFTRCIFEGDVTCYDMKAGGPVDFSGSKFLHTTGANFSYMTVQSGVSINYAVFAGPVSFAMSRINGDLQMVEATFSFQTAGCDECYYTPYQADALDASEARVGGNCYMAGIVSKGAVDLSGIVVGRSLNASNSTFENTATEVRCDRIKIGGVTDFSGSSFAAGIDLRNGEFGEALLLDDVTSDGPISLNESRVAANVSCDGIRCKEKATFDVSGMKAKSLSLESGDLFCETNLQELQSAGLVSFDNTCFMHPSAVNMIEARVGNLTAVDTHFEGGINAFHILVSGSMDFRGAWIESENGISCEVGDIKAGLHLSEMLSKGNINFSTANVGNVFVKDVLFAKPNAVVSFANATVNHLATFGHVNGDLALQEARFELLFFEGMPEAANRYRINLVGTKYSGLRVNGSDRLEEFLQLLRNTRFHVSPFTSVENYLRTNGRPSDASEVFIAYRRAESRQSHWARRVFGYVCDVLAGYGRHMERLGWCLIAFVGLGTIVFWRRAGMVPKGDSRSEVYNPFWYSLGLFLPFDNLGISRDWVPREDRWFARHYAHVQQLAGWIIVSIGIGILIGLR